VVVVSYSGKEINAKLVYYGAGLCGKTTNLEAIYEAVPDTSRGKMVSMKTQSDRTLFFDLLPLDLGEIMGFKTRFLLYTVPGQVFYNATRKLVLKGADAVVFVADSEVGKMEENKESLANLRTNLAEYNISLDSLPWVMQYNKRDLPNIYSIEELNAELNPGGKVPFFESVAREGKGVFETFRGISHLLMEKVTKDLRRTPGTRTSAPEPVEAAAPRESVRATAPPPAPVQAIQQEALATPAPIEGGNQSRIDYGREIELPDTQAAVARAAEPAPAPAPAPAAASMMMQVPAGMRAAAASAAAPAAPAPVRAAAPAPVATPASAVAAPPAPSAPAPAAAAPSPAVAPSPAAASSPSQPSVSPAHSNGDSPQPVKLVVPVTIAKGGTYEIVIKLQVGDDD
jgi:mutual gliding-motility protein MglA